MGNKESITQDEVRRLFSYNPTTGLVTRRTFTRGGYKVGSVVGFTSTNAYLRVKINCKIYMLHTVIWLWMTGKLPMYQIDHINRIHTDNRWKNLRDLHRKGNAQNSSIRSDSSSGVRGVCFATREGKWRAHITVDGRNIHLGYFVNISEAIEARHAEEGKRNWVDHKS